ncbi:cytochrome P450 2K1-like [Hypomesus transpacificus]|uniref:cytochrome P450 2K1-like n=1 Tax=Hypomesus transpacificus TaxID=137520 RepID=UPI001F085001|nr:cytochrome P450 2K1-like [Hypomesus transpacificus]
MSVLDSIVLQTPSLVTLLGTVVFLLLLYLLSCSSQEQGKDPPGPRPLPLLGNLLMLDLKRPYQTLCELSKKYGSVFKIHFGPQKVVVLAGYKTVKEALVNHAEEFGDRDITPIFQDLNNGHGILFSNGESWKEMRRFASTTLKNLGMGKKMSEEKITEECGNLIEVFEQHEGKAFDTTQSVNYAVSNIISAIVYGNRFDYSDPKFRAMVDRATETVCLLGSPTIQLYNAFPWMGPCIWNQRRIMKLFNIDKEEIKDLIRGLKETLNPQMCQGFLDCFLTRQQNLEESGSVASLYHDDNIVYSVANLFAAGTDTTGTTLRWGLLLMAKYPHMQDQVQEEISRVIGSRQVLVEDRKNLPYTDAVIHETQRLANIVPMSIPHVTSRDVTFQGYLIKKGTSVIPLLTSVLQDESEWESPHTFNPAHFLDDKGKFVKRDAFMPFSAGRRACPGEGLARMELFLFFTSLLQHFHFSPPPGVTEDDLDLTPAVGFTLVPSPHQLCAVSRG